jgi:hypothetical protein
VSAGFVRGALGLIGIFALLGIYQQVKKITTHRAK